jgi:hypothetical protein
MNPTKTLPFLSIPRRVSTYLIVSCIFKSITYKNLFLATTPNLPQDTETEQPANRSFRRWPISV